MANPTLLDMPIARDGNKNTIPATDNGTTGLLSQQYGWQLINAIPPQQGGKAVKREDFNGALYLLSNLLFYLQKGWQFEWASNQTYYAGCVVKDTSDGKMYMCLNDVTSTTAPHSDTTNWKLWDLSSYLPLAGGKLTGRYIYRSVDNSYIEIIGGTQAGKGGRIRLYGAENQDQTHKGYFGLCATDGTNTAWLEGFPNGTLTWGSNDLGGSAIVAKSLTRNGYIKYASGLILQWGYAWIESDTTQGSVTFPIAFTARSVIICDANRNSATVMTAWPTTTGASVYTNTQGSYSFDWFAIGY